MTLAAVTAGGGRRRLALTIADQTVSSASNFGTGVAVARLSGAAAFGQYVLMFMVWLVVVGFHRALITEPVIVTSSGPGTRRPAVRTPPTGQVARLRASRSMAHGFAADLVLGLSATALVSGMAAACIILGGGIGVPLLALSPWFVSLLVQDYWRAMAFKQRRPGMALLNDGLFAVVQFGAIACFAVLGWRSVGAMIAAWGLGATAGALLGVLIRPGLGRLSDGCRLIVRLWPTSRWMLADFVTSFASDQSFLLFAAVALAATEYGGFRAAFSLMGPPVVILQAGGNIGLPEASRLASREDPAELRRFALRLTAGTLCAIGAYGVAIGVGSGRVLGALYGSQFSQFGDLVVLAAIQYVLLVSVFGQLIALKAARRMRWLWRVRVGIAVVSLTSLFVLVRALGTTGAGWAGVVTGAAYAAGIYAVYRAELGGTRRPSAPVEAGSSDPSGGSASVPGLDPAAAGSARRSRADDAVREAVRT